MTGEEGKKGNADGEGGDVRTTDLTSDNNQNIQNANNNINMNGDANNQHQQQQSNGTDKAPVAPGTNVETLPRTGKQVQYYFFSGVVYLFYNLLILKR